MRPNYFYCLLIIILICSCSGTSYWTAENEYPRSRVHPCEIHITDSTYTIISYDNSRNRGDIHVFKSEFRGDTLLVYELYDRSWAESATSNFQFVIIDAYLKKGRKLYPLYWTYPPIYPKRGYNHYVNHDTKRIDDKSRVRTIPIDWTGTEEDTVYINLKGYYQARGKYKKMRETIERNNISDSTLWEIKLPRQKINDTSAINSEWIIKHGTLQTKKGKFVDLR